MSADSIMGESSQPDPNIPEVELVQKEPAAGRKFPCPKCGARLDFAPGSRDLACPYCGHREVIDPGNDKVRERDWEAYWHNQTGPETVLEGRTCEVRCGGCGAIVLLEDKQATSQCPYCANHLENEPESARAMIPPEGVLPFRIERREAITAFQQWVASRWFAPNEFSRVASLGQFQGVYLPFWTFDSMTYTRYQGERGDDYTVQETYTEKDAQGQSVTKTRQVTKTRWKRVSGQVQHFFDDVLVCGSRSLPEDLVQQLEPWDLEKLEKFRPEFLSGFQTERYAVGLKEGFEQARAIMDQEIRNLCCRAIGGDHQRLEAVQTQHVGVTYKLLQLPAWIAAYRYHNEPYRVLVNARTGEVVGTRPYSWIKITLLVLAIAALVLLLVFLFNGGGGAGGGGAPLPAEKPEVRLPSPPGIAGVMLSRPPQSIYVEPASTGPRKHAVPPLRLVLVAGEAAYARRH